MAPLYKKTLIIGATSGIGEALAAKLHAEGTSVIVTGRRQDRLDAFVANHPGSSGVVIDITKFDDIPSFVASVTQQHPDIDSVVLNAGIQRPFNFAKPETVDLSTFAEEFNTNYVSFVHLVKAFLPHLQRVSKDAEAHLVFINASLALVPTLTRTPGYNASKAALHSFIVNVRQQIKDAGYKIRLVEVFPPAVQTEIHDTKHQPDMINGHEIGMPLGPYTERMYEGLQKGDEQFAIGHAEEWLNEGGFEATRAKLFEQGHVTIKEALAKYVKSA
ncbi:putative oxidoreductase DltE [Daldinia childiae]|uniref:putative oxidoreductase DltE n=1 Tax=Daldinia childiae TaxID=326645 RepID=UPI001448497D|nr:putative oxidoreductase DltE [Daldinia childiae]KAF3059204.1 putative oxidoreductase DltE [Daldinia childiae]